MIKLWEQTFRRMCHDLKVHDASYSRSQEGGAHTRNVYERTWEKKQDWQNTHWVEDSDPEPAWNSCHRGEEQETCSTPHEAVQTAAAEEETCSSLLLIIEGRFKLRRQLHTVTDGWRKIKIFVSIWGQKQSWLPYVPDEERYQLADLL